MTNSNVAFYLGGFSRDTVSNASVATARHWLPASGTEWTENPVLEEALTKGAVFIDTDDLGLKVWNGSAWVSDLDTPKTISSQWTFAQMPLVAAGGAVGDVPIVPAGGIGGQVLSKVDGNDYNLTWSDPPSGTFDPAFDYTITGSWTFSSPILFSQKVTFTPPSLGVLPESAGDVTAGYLIRQTDAAVDERLWTVQVNSGDLSLTTRDDAGTFGQAAHTMFRNGTTVTSHHLLVNAVISAHIKDRTDGCIWVYDRNDAVNEVATKYTRRTPFTNTSSYTLQQSDEEHMVTFSGETLGTIITAPTLKQGTRIKIYNLSDTQTQTLNAGTGGTINYYREGGPRISDTNWQLAPGAAVTLEWATSNNVVYMTGVGAST